VKVAIALCDGVLDGLGVVGLAVAAGAEVANAGHAPPTFAACGFALAAKRP
jgi:hypothetical protein